ncbi:MAG TPA: TetR/AcrR family transcriptional regulator [Polyangiaceae bacterium]|nr:TetR/AcrR family transcriptional regulator [Polyangiaceae bacterium]
MDGQKARSAAPEETAGGGPASSRRGDRDLREAIRHHAAALFAERGYAATSMRDIAEAASCTKPALYYHFDSKQALFVDVLRTEIERLTSVIGDAVQQPTSTRERMTRAARDYLDQVRRHPVGLKLVMRAEMHPERDQPAFDFQSTRAQIMDQVTEMLTEGMKAGEIRADLDVPVFIDAVGGALDNRAMLFVLAGEPIPDDYPERMLDTLFRGLAP